MKYASARKLQGRPCTRDLPKSSGKKSSGGKAGNIMTADLGLNTIFQWQSKIVARDGSRAIHAKSKNRTKIFSELAAVSHFQQQIPKQCNRIIHGHFSEACEDLTWNRNTSTPHRSETNGRADKAVRRVTGWRSPLFMELRHARSRSKVRSTRLRFGDQNR